MRGLGRRLVVGSGGWWPNPGRGIGHRRSIRCSSSSSQAAHSSYFDRVKGFSGPFKSALTSGLLSGAGDLLTQTITTKDNPDGPSWDWQRTARFMGWGAVFYGPFQFYWYNLLNWLMPAASTANFLTKVAANQVVLAPIVLATVFSWNLSLTGAAEQIPRKVRDDLVPTMLNGWKFWIPAACVNFYCVPISYQVLYMSTCGMLWSAYLSYASTTTIKVQPAS